MASSLTVNGYNVGVDISLTISNQFGDVFNAGDLGHFRGIDCKFDTENLKIQPISRGGKPLYLMIPSGLSGTLKFTRFNGSLTNVFSSLYQAFYTAGILPKWTYSAAVVNRDGTTDKYIWTGAVFANPDFGSFQDVREVDQGMSFNAENLLTTSNLASIVPSLVAAINGGIV